jgi:putative transposase
MNYGETNITALNYQNISGKISLAKYLWKEQTFFSDGAFVCTCGDASHETIRLYIENQG